MTVIEICRPVVVIEVPPIPVLQHLLQSCFSARHPEQSSSCTVVAKGGQGDPVHTSVNIAASMHQSQSSCTDVSTLARLTDSGS